MEAHAVPYIPVRATGGRLMQQYLLQLQSQALAGVGRLHLVLYLQDNNTLARRAASQNQAA